MDVPLIEELAEILLNHLGEVLGFGFRDLGIITSFMILDENEARLRRGISHEGFRFGAGNHRSQRGFHSPSSSSSASSIASSVKSTVKVFP